MPLEVHLGLNAPKQYFIIHNMEKISSHSKKFFFFQIMYF
jgi:hypothetical protein